MNDIQLSRSEESRRRITKMLDAKHIAEQSAASAAGIPQFQYDSELNLAKVEVVRSETPPARFTYVYDEVGRLAGIQPLNEG